MVKNITGGNKTKFLSRSKIGNNKKTAFRPPNYLDGEGVGIITKSLGSSRFDVKALYNNTIITGNCSVSRKTRVANNDIVIITVLRGNISGLILGEIVHKYDPLNIYALKEYDQDYIKTHALSRNNIIKILRTETRSDDTSELFDIGEKSFIDNIKTDDIDISDI